MTFEITPQTIIIAAAAFGAIIAIAAYIAKAARWVNEQKKQGETPMNTANKVLVVLGSFVLAFVIAMIITFWRFQSVPDTLIQYTLGAGGIEVLALAGIKISKVWSGKKGSEDTEDE